MRNGCLRQHAALVDRVHVRDQHDLLRARALEGGAHHLADLLGRVVHAVGIGRRLDQLDLAAERLELVGDQVGDLVQAFEVAAAGLDRDQLLQGFEQRGLFLGGERGDAFVGRGASDAEPGGTDCAEA